MILVKRMRPLLGTYVEVGARAGSGAAAERAVDAAFEAVRTVHGRLSFHALDSDLTRLNRAGGEAVELQPLSLRVLRLAQAMMVATAGLFDMTVGGALVRRGALPDLGGPAPLARGEAGDLQLGRGWARLLRPVRITLDGIAKGYAVDLAVSAMRAHGATSGWVNAGGDLRAFGRHAVPVHRREADDTLVPLGALRDAAIATSHARAPDAAWDAGRPALIVPLSPAQPMAGVFSVLARKAWRADALTKVACQMAGAPREAMLRRLGGVLVLPAAADAGAPA
ncbi:FAD:protein FMN transferase [Piscinibacter sp. XHJ-5]|uniref:FAD:protein FMN transferase n=1 Tax=Piscinibacter sp. XHJ-5 TaxID=3037797 RepID=UPI002453099A|nr:FAD:protein FMN transferase [Piscinibacter sp. XHJ-5]